MLIDGSWVDGSSIIMAVVFGGVKTRRYWRHRTRPRRINSRQITFDIISGMMSGASLVPFLLMVGAVFSSELLKTALDTSKVFMGLGGLVGVVLIASELLKS